MVRKNRKETGSALLAAVIIVMIVIGIGGAFLAETAYRHKVISSQIEKDETTLLAESGLEKARRALWRYRVEGIMPWDQLLLVCRWQLSPDRPFGPAGYPSQSGQRRSSSTSRSVLPHVAGSSAGWFGSGLPEVMSPWSLEMPTARVPPRRRCAAVQAPPASRTAHREHWTQPPG